jgi:hypothetical protein
MKTSEEIDKISSLYRKALSFYALPVLSLILYALDMSTFKVTDIFFLIIVFFSLAPCGFFGLIFSYKGYKFSKRIAHNIKQDIGYANLILGVVYIFIGTLFSLASIIMLIAR